MKEEKYQGNMQQVIVRSAYTWNGLNRQQMRDVTKIETQSLSLH